MKRSILIFGVAVPAMALLLFYLIVPTGKDPMVFARIIYGADRAAQAEFNAYIASSDTLQAYTGAIKIADSRARARAAAGLGQGLLVRAEGGATTEQRAKVEVIAREELRALGVAEPRHPIAVIVTVDTTAFYPRFERAVVLPHGPGEACGIVLRISGRFPQFHGMGNTDRLLGTCGFFAVYGTPGPGMLRWLNETRMRRAAYLQRPESHGDGVVRDPGEVNAANRSESVVACRAGRMEGCRMLFNAEGEERENEMFWMRAMPVVAPVDSSVAMYGPWTIGSSRVAISYGLLANLASDVGPEKFSAIWTSVQEPEEAFLTVSGRSVGELVAEQLRTRLVEYRAGPGLPASQWLLALGMIGVPLGLVLRFAGRVLS